MQENDKVTLQEIADKTNITKRAIDKNIKMLKENGVIERVGSNKTGSWRVK